MLFLLRVMKSAKVSDHLLLPKSSDPWVSETVINLKSGNWKVSHAVREGESTLEFKKIIGCHQSNSRFWINVNPKIPRKLLSNVAYRKLFSAVVQETEKQKLQAKAAQLSLQGQLRK